MVTESDFEALTCTEISQIQDLGDFGGCGRGCPFAGVNDGPAATTVWACGRWVLPLVLSYDPDDGPKENDAVIDGKVGFYLTIKQ